METFGDGGKGCGDKYVRGLLRTNNFHCNLAMKKDKLTVCKLVTTFPSYKGDSRGRGTIYTLCRLLARAGLNVKVLAPLTPISQHYEEMEKVQVYRFAYSPFRRCHLLNYPFAMYLNIRRKPFLILLLPFFILSFVLHGIKFARKCDVIHAHQLHCAIVGIIVKKYLKKPLVVTPWGTDIRTFPRWLSNWIFRHADLVTRPFPYSFTDIPGNTVVFHTSVIDEEEFGPHVDPTPFKKEFGIKDDDFVISFIGRLYEFKDPITFVEAIPDILHHIKNAKFLIVGDGPLRTLLESRVKKLGVESYVIFTGKRADIPQILRTSNIFVSLDITGNPGNTILAETFASEVPAIVTEIPRSSSWYKQASLKHLREAYLIPAKNREALVKAVIFLHDHPEIMENLVKYGKMWLLKHNRVSKTAIPYLVNLYFSLARSKSKI